MIQSVFVPENIEYMTQWTEYRLPQGHSVIDKSVCGCGFTEYCIQDCNPYDTILCSPRKILLKNKKKQHNEDWEWNIYHFQSEFLSAEFKDGAGKKYEEDSPEYNAALMQYKADAIRNHLFMCRTSGRHCVFLVTYDSFHFILEALGESILGFHVVVDEFQSLFLDAFYKADTEDKFLRVLRSVPNVVYLSATPMTTKYLQMLPEFQNLPYYKFIWPASRLMKVHIEKQKTSDLIKSALQVIKTYKEKSYNCKFVLDSNGSPYYSREAVLYFNSVVSIRKLIIRAGLTPSECNIICADDEINKKKIQSIKSPDGKLFTIGEIPKKGEPHKMFTFCTKTAYLGSDFYSLSARSFVFSDANIKSLALDIRQDLAQILGRQRLKENPWHNEVVVFYKTIYDPSKLITEENFLLYSQKKERDAINLQEEFLKSRAPDLLRDLVKDGALVAKTEAKYYLGLDNNGNVVYNPFLKIADLRAWELSNKEGDSDINVFNTMLETFGSGSISTYKSPEDESIDRLDKALLSLSDVRNRFEAFCEYIEKYKGDQELMRSLENKYQGSKFFIFYTHFGYDTCKAHHFNCTELSKMMQQYLYTGGVISEVMKVFEIGNRYTCKYIKETLKSIYSTLGISKTAKATDLDEYLVVRPCKALDQDGKWQKGYEVISVK